MAKAKPKEKKSLEQTLWDAAITMRGNLEPGEYKHVVLGLVFLKYISDRFVERRSELETELKDEGIPEPRLESFLEDRDEYTSQNVFGCPSMRAGNTCSRWPNQLRLVNSSMVQWTLSKKRTGRCVGSFPRITAKRD